MTPDLRDPEALANLLDTFTRRYGEAPLRLATHAAVADRLTPELLALIRQNFLEGPDRFEPAHDADVLFGPLCTAQGGAVYEMRSEVRTFLFGALDREYPVTAGHRYRSQDVARMIRHYLDGLPPPERDRSGHLTQVHQHNLWRVLAIDAPDVAFRKLRDHTRERLALPRDEWQNAPRAEGVVAVTGDVFGAFQEDMAYVEAIDLMAADNAEGSVALLDFLVEVGFEPSEPGLEPPAKLLAEEQRFDALRRNTVRGSGGPGQQGAATDTDAPKTEDTEIVRDVEIDIDKFDLRDSPLSRAALAGDMEALEAALPRNANRINALDRFGFAPLHHAVYYGHEAMARRLLEAGADPDLESVYKSTPLFFCATHGLTDLARDLLQLGAAPAKLTSKSSTPLMMACHYGYRDLVHLLLAQEAVDAEHVALPNHEGNTALHWAVGAGDHVVVDLLTELGATLDLSTGKKWSLLHWAVYGQSLQMTLRMLEAGAPVNAVNQQGATPLHFACWDRPSAEIADVLLECGADPFRLTDFGFTPSRLAANWNNPDCLDLLAPYETFTEQHMAAAAWNGATDALSHLSERYDLDLLPATRVDPLIKSGRPRAYDFLLERASDFGQSSEELFQKAVQFAKPTLLHHIRKQGHPIPNLPDKVNNWVGMIDTKSDQRDATIAALLEFPAQLETLVGGESYLATAAKEGLVETVDALLARGVDVAATGTKGSTPLATALESDQIEMARRFLDEGADPNLIGTWPAALKASAEGLRLIAEHGADFTRRGLRGETYLHVWAERPDKPVKNKAFDSGAHETGLEIALSQGLSVDLPDFRGWTPLHVAAWHNRDAAIRRLVAAGARVDATADDGITPYLRALQRESTAAAKALKEAGADPGHRTPGGWSALHITAELGQVKALPSIWEDVGAEDRPASVPPRTAMQVAAEAGALDVIKFLLGKEVPPDHRAGLTPPPMHLALEVGAVEAARLLFEHGASCWVPDMATGMTGFARAEALGRRISLTELQPDAVGSLIRDMLRTRPRPSRRNVKRPED